MWLLPNVTGIYGANLTIELLLSFFTERTVKSIRVLVIFPALAPKTAWNTESVRTLVIEFILNPTAAELESWLSPANESPSTKALKCPVKEFPPLKYNPLSLAPFKSVVLAI